MITATATVDHAPSPHDDDIASFAFIREEPTSRYALQLLLNALEQNLGPNLLRVKGLVNVAEEPGRPAVIQGAQHLLHNICLARPLARRRPAHAHRLHHPELSAAPRSRR